jgi:hypothetical protein
MPAKQLAWKNLALHLLIWIPSSSSAVAVFRVNCLTIDPVSVIAEVILSNTSADDG